MEKDVKTLKLLSAMTMSTAVLLMPISALAQSRPGPVKPTPISTCCPPSTSFPLATMFNSVQGNVTTSYHLNFTLNATFSAQMAAYAALLKTLDPSVTALAMSVSAYNGGTAATPVISGGPLQTAAVFWVPPPSPTVTIWPSAFFTSTANVATNTWTVVEITAWIGRRNGFVPTCEVRRFAFRPQIIGLRSSKASASGFVDYKGPAPRKAPAPPVAPPAP